MSTNILALSSKEAMDHLMTSEQYHNFELPAYFDFGPVLEFVEQRIGDKSYDDCLTSHPASELHDVNFDILLNKDGHYAVRPLMLCNPYLYYFLVRELCGKTNWKAIKDNFAKCTTPHITSCAMPIIPSGKEKFHKADTILNWWNNIEQRSIELSLQYRYMFVTDITNCYGTINPQCIDWALARKDTKRATGKNHILARNIMRYLSDMQQGRNIGIPQGSTVFDIVAEIVLSYADLLLHEAIEKKMGNDIDYTVLRYRDDYRIFCNDKGHLETISYILQEVLETLNFRMNSSKTLITDSVVTASIKSDKLAYIENTPIYNKQGSDFDNNFQKHLLYILLFGRKYPNSGQMRTMMSDLNTRIETRINDIKEGKDIIVIARGTFGNIPLDDEDEDLDDEETNTEPETSTDAETEPKESLLESFKSYTRRIFIGNVRAMVAIACQIAIENVAIAHYALRMVSLMISTLTDDKEKIEIINLVYNRLKNQANNTYIMLWLQNMTYKIDCNNQSSPYEARLCRLVMEQEVDLWNNKWLKRQYTRDLPVDAIVDKDTLDATTGIIDFRERLNYMELVDIPEEHILVDEVEH